MELADDGTTEGEKNASHGGHCATRPTAGRRTLTARRNDAGARPRSVHTAAVHLLCLIRFIALHGDDASARAGCDAFAARLAGHLGREIHREDLQMMLVFEEPESALGLLHRTLAEGAVGGFGVSAGMAQGIRSRATVASSLSGFTEGSIEALFEIASNADPQEIAISPKLSSLIRLAAPSYSASFRAVACRRPESRIRSPMIMTLASAPPERSGARG